MLIYPKKYLYALIKNVLPKTFRLLESKNCFEHFKSLLVWKYSKEGQLLKITLNSIVLYSQVICFI